MVWMFGFAVLIVSAGSINITLLLEQEANILFNSCIILTGEYSLSILHFKLRLFPLHYISCLRTKYLTWQPIYPLKERIISRKGAQIARHSGYLRIRRQELDAHDQIASETTNGEN